MKPVTLAFWPACPDPADIRKLLSALGVPPQCRQANFYAEVGNKVAIACEFFQNEGAPGKVVRSVRKFDLVERKPEKR